jgi:maltose O-acetyltransferase
MTDKRSLTMICRIAAVSRAQIRRIASTLRIFKLRMEAVVAGGRVEIQAGVRVHHPTRFMGRGTLVLEEGCVLGYPPATASRVPILLQPREPEAVIRIGARCVIVNGTEIIAREAITIGPDSLIGPRCVLMDSDFHGLHPADRSSAGLSKPIVLERNVWLGSESMVLKGVTLGRDAVVAARTVVRNSYPKGAVVAHPRAEIIDSVYRSPRNSDS